MIKGLYTSARGMTPETSKLEIAAHNIANVSTTGFKRTKIFDGILTREASGPVINGAGSIKNDFRVSVDFAQGEMRETKNPLDVAMIGDGFFVLETPEGPMYTRNGNFTLGADGTLISGNGFPVQGEQGTIRIPDTDKTPVTSLMINEKGEIYLGEKKLDRIRTVDFTDKDVLHPENNNLFSAPEDVTPEDVAAPAVTVHQGYLEESNVDIIKEMIAMIDSRQSFETSQKMIRSQETTLDHANEVGRMP